MAQIKVNPEQEYNFAELLALSQKQLNQLMQLQNFLEGLKKAPSLEQIMRFARQEFAKWGIRHDYLFNRLTNLIQIAAEENEPEISAHSLKGLLFFLYLLKEFSKPKITLNDAGLFEISWQQSRSDDLTISFKDTNTLSYVIFRPSHYTEKRIVLNGSMNLLDFKDYISALQLQTYKG